VLQGALREEARREGRPIDQMKDEDYIDIDGEIDRKRRT